MKIKKNNLKKKVMLTLLAGGMLCANTAFAEWYGKGNGFVNSCPDPEVITGVNAIIDDSTTVDGEWVGDVDAILGGYTETADVAVTANSITFNTTNETTLYQVYIFAGYSCDTGDAKDNIATVNGGTFNGGDYYGGDYYCGLYGGYSYAGDATGNNVSINDGTFESYCVIYGGYSYNGKSTGNSVNFKNGNFMNFMFYGGSSYSGDVTDNSMTIDGGSFAVYSGLYGGSTTWGIASGNKVIINDAMIDLASVYGGESTQNNATGNSVTVNGGTFSCIFYGGSSDYKNAMGNSVNVNGGTFNNASFYGGSSSYVDASENSIIIRGGTFNGISLYVGTSLKGAVTGNSVTIEGGVFDNSELYGGRANSGARYDGESSLVSNATDNSVTIKGGVFKCVTIYGGMANPNIYVEKSRQGIGNATDNSITVEGGVFNNSKFYGGMASNGTSSGNTLNLKTVMYGTAAEVKFFQNMNFTIPTGATSETIMMRVDNSNAMALSGIAFNTDLNGLSLGTGDYITLVKGVDGTVGTFTDSDKYYVLNIGGIKELVYAPNGTPVAKEDYTVKDSDGVILEKGTASTYPNTTIKAKDATVGDDVTTGYTITVRRGTYGSTASGDTSRIYGVKSSTKAVSDNEIHIIDGKFLFGSTIQSDDNSIIAGIVEYDTATGDVYNNKVTIDGGEFTFSADTDTYSLNPIIVAGMAEGTVETDVHNVYGNTVEINDGSFGGNGTIAAGAKWGQTADADGVVGGTSLENGNKLLINNISFKDNSRYYLRGGYASVDNNPVPVNYNTVQIRNINFGEDADVYIEGGRSQGQRGGSVSYNLVDVQGSTLNGMVNVCGGYGYGDSASTQTDSINMTAEGNKVNFVDTTVMGMLIAGCDVFSGSEQVSGVSAVDVTTNVKDNEVYVKGVTAGFGVVIGGSANANGDSDTFGGNIALTISGNKVKIVDSTFQSGLNLVGGDETHDFTDKEGIVSVSVTDNRVEIENSSVGDDVEIYGGTAKTGNVSGNHVKISDNSFAGGGEIYGGTAKAGNVSGNHVQISDSSVGGDVEIYGGMTWGGEVNKNHIEISGSSFEGDAYAYGGMTFKGNANENKTVVESGSFAGNVAFIGGYSFSAGNANNNTVSILNDADTPCGVTVACGYAEAGEANGNTLNIGKEDGATVFSNMQFAMVAGGLGVTGSSGNKLNLYTSVKSNQVSYFQEMNFYLPADIANGDTMLNTAAMTFDETKITIDVNSSGVFTIAEGTVINLIDASGEMTGTYSVDKIFGVDATEASGVYSTDIAKVEKSDNVISLTMLGKYAQDVWYTIGSEEKILGSTAPAQTISGADGDVVLYHGAGENNEYGAITTTKSVTVGAETEIGKSFLVSGDLTAANGVTVAAKNTLNIAAGNLKSAVANSGMVVLKDGTLASGSTITGGTVNITGDVSANASDIAGDTNNVAEGKTLTLNGGTLGGDLGGAGSVAVDGVVTSGKNIANNVEVASTGDFTVSGGSVAGTVENNSKLFVDGGYVTGKIINSGTLAISDGTVELVDNSGIMTVTSLESLTGDITNSGTVNLDAVGALTSKITNTGVVNLNTGKFSDVGTAGCSDLANITAGGTINLQGNAVYNTETANVFTAGIAGIDTYSASQKAAEDKNTFVAANKELPTELKTNKLTFVEGNIEFADAFYTASYAKNAKKLLNEYKYNGTDLSKTALVFTGTIVSEVEWKDDDEGISHAEGKVLLNEIVEHDKEQSQGQGETKKIVYDTVVAETLAGSLLVGKELDPNINTEVRKATGGDEGIDVKESTEKGFNVAQLDLSNGATGVVITNKEDVTVGGSRANGAKDAVQIVTVQGKSGQEVKVVVGLEKRTAQAIGLENDANKGVLNIGNIKADPEKAKYELNGTVVVNPGSAMNVNGQTTITKGIVLTGAKVDVAEKAKVEVPKVEVTNSDAASVVTGVIKANEAVQIKKGSLEVGTADKGAKLVTPWFQLDDSSAHVGQAAVVEAERITVESTEKEDQTRKSVITGEVKASESLTMEKASDNTPTVLNVGTDDKQARVEVAKTVLRGNMLFLDPAWKDGVGLEGASHYATNTTNLDGAYVVGMNSMLTFGAANAEADEVFDYSKLTWGENNVSAAVYLAKDINVAGGSLLVDGSLEAAPEMLDAGSVKFAAGSLLMLKAQSFKDAYAISDIKSVEVNNGSIMLLQNAEAGDTYKILQGDDNTITDSNTWKEAQIKTNAITKAVVELDETNKSFYHVRIEANDYDFDGTIAPNTLQGMNKGEATSAAHKYISAVTGAEYTKAAQNANMNRMADMPEELGVMHDHFTVSNMAEDAVAQHLALDGDKMGRDIWARAFHAKEDVDGLGLGIQGNRYTAQYNGAIVGVDIVNRGNTTLGAAITYVDGKASNGGSHNEGKYYGVTLYGRTKLAKDAGVQYDLSYLHSGNDLDMNSGVESFAAITGDQKVNSVSVGARLEKQVKVGQSSFIPHIGARYLRMKGDSFNNSLGVKYSPDATNTFIVPLGIGFKTSMVNSGWKMSLLADVGYQWNLGNKDYTQHTSYHGYADKFDVAFADRNSWYAGVGLEFNKKNFTAGVGYRYAKSSSSKQNRWNINLSFSF